MARRPKQYLHLREPQRSVAVGLDRVLFTMLPVRLDVVLEHPILLRCVGFDGEATTADQLELASYVKKLDTKIRQLLDEFDVDGKGDAARILFGYAPGSAIAGVGRREKKAAEKYFVTWETVDRWRDKDIVPYLASQLYQSRVTD